MDKGKGKRIRSDDVDEASTHEEEILKLHDRYKAIMVRLNEQIQAKEDILHAVIKIERADAKIRMLLKQVGAHDFDFQNEINRLEVKKERFEKRYEDLKIPHIDYDKLGCNLKKFGGPFGDGSH